MSYYLLGRHDEALAAADRALALAPDNLDARLITAAAYRIAKKFRDDSPLDRLLESLARAGLPEGDSSAVFNARKFESRRRAMPHPRV